MASFIFTSESVSMGHPDKVADQISDGVLDALLAADPRSRVACETLCTTDTVVLAGEITSQAKVDYVQVARNAVRDIGYTSDDIGFNADTFRCFVWLRLQPHAGVHARPDRAGAPHHQPLDRSPAAANRRLAPSGQQEPSQRRIP